MRGLLKAFLLLAPVLAGSFAVPPQDIAVDGSYIFIDVEVPSPHGGPHSLAFRLDVFPSEEACGLANVAIDGQSLHQSLDGGFARGEGSITLHCKNVVAASWSSTCIKVNGQPDSQLLEFLVESVDARAVRNIGFSALFRQTGMTEIISVTTDLSIPATDLANPDPEHLQEANHEDDFIQFSVEDEVQELRWLKAQRQELELLILTKERAIAEHSSAYFQENIKDCDSLKCIAKVVFGKARKATHHIMHKIKGHKKGHGHGHAGPGHHRHGNHTCGSPKRGNHTEPPHWEMPHHRPLPICRYPPPPEHGRPPPPPASHEHSDMPPLSPRPHNGPEDDMGLHHEGHHRPSHDEMNPHDGSFDESQLHGGPHNSPHDPSSFEAEAEAPFHHPETRPGASTPLAPFERPGPREPHHRPMGRAFHVAKFLVIGMLISFFVIALHRRIFKLTKRADRQARREERCRRRQFRRAARRHAITRFFDRLSGHDSQANEDYEEKRQALLASAENGMSTSIAEEIAELQNAADVVDDLFSESSRHSYHIPTPSASTSSVAELRSLLSGRDYDTGSQSVNGEELPAYEDNDGSEMNSVVADGFRYSPGTSEYDPVRSPPGSVSDILGPDTKQ